MIVDVTCFEKNCHQGNTPTEQCTWFQSCTEIGVRQTDGMIFRAATMFTFQPNKLTRANITAGPFTISLELQYTSTVFGLTTTASPATTTSLRTTTNARPTTLAITSLPPSIARTSPVLITTVTGLRTLSESAPVDVTELVGDDATTAPGGELATPNGSAAIIGGVLGGVVGLGLCLALCLCIAKRAKNRRIKDAPISAEALEARNATQLAPMPPIDRPATQYVQTSSHYVEELPRPPIDRPVTKYVEARHNYSDGRISVKSTIDLTNRSYGAQAPHVYTDIGGRPDYRTLRSFPSYEAVEPATSAKSSSYSSPDL
jgi:hypothetical protein